MFVMTVEIIKHHDNGMDEVLNTLSFTDNDLCDCVDTLMDTKNKANAIGFSAKMVSVLPV